MKKLGDIIFYLEMILFHTVLALVFISTLILFYRSYYWLRYDEWLRTTLAGFYNIEFTHTVTSSWLGIDNLIFWMINLDVLYSCILGTIVGLFVFLLMTKITK